MPDEQTRPDELEPITNRELEIMARYQQTIVVITPEGRRRIWLADLAREISMLRAAATPGAVEAATDDKTTD
jgi:hypothetical protein